jgi:hypothetical protein
MPSPENAGADKSSQRNESNWAPGEWWEWIAIFIAILSLWPRVLRWPNPIWDVFLWGAVVLMIVVLVRRVRRTRDPWRKN